MTISKQSMGSRRFIRSEKHNLGNPFRFPAAAAARIPILLLFGLCALFILGVFYWIFFSPAFAIERIRLETAIALPADDLSGLLHKQFTRQRFGIISQKNIFAFDGEEFSTALSQQFALSSIYLRKNRPHEIIVTVSEKPRNAIWNTRGINFAINAQGAVLGAVAKPRSVDGAMLVYEQGEQLPSVGQQIISPTMLAFLTRLFQHNKIRPLHPQFFIIAKPGVSEFSLKVGEGWKIVLNASAELESQLASLELVLRNTVPPDTRKNLDYIDLRFGEKVYYKYR